MQTKLSRLSATAAHHAASKIAPTTTGLKKAKKLIAKKKLDRAFRLMEETGLIADQGTYCCKLDATINLVVLSSHALVRGEVCFGFAYYDEEDEELRKNGETFWIGFGPSMDEDLVPALSFDEIGESICVCLDEAKVPFRWTAESQRIEILQNPNDQSSASPTGVVH